MTLSKFLGGELFLVQFWGRLWGVFWVPSGAVPPPVDSDDQDGAQTFGPLLLG